MPYFTKLYQADLPHRAKLVYIYLHDRMDNEKKAWPGLGTIAKDLSLSRSTVKRAVKDLENVALRTKCKKFAHKTQKGEESDSSGILAFFAYYYEMLRSRLV